MPSGEGPKYTSRMHVLQANSRPAGLLVDSRDLVALARLLYAGEFVCWSIATAPFQLEFESSRVGRRQIRFAL